MDLVSTPERSCGSPGWPGKLCAQPSDVRGPDFAARWIKAVNCQACLVSRESWVPDARVVDVASGHGFILAPSDSYFAIVRRSTARKLPFRPVLRAHSSSDLCSVLRLVLGPQVHCRSGASGRGHLKALSNSVLDSVCVEKELAFVCRTNFWHGSTRRCFGRHVWSPSPPRVPFRSRVANPPWRLA